MLGTSIELADVLRAAIWAVAVWVAIVWIVGFGYIVVTLAESHGRIPSRSPGAVLRSALTEMWYVAWTQPLLPLFQVMGRRLSFPSGSTPIILVHGYSQNRVDFLYLAGRLTALGAGPIYAVNFFWPQRFERSAVTVLRFVERVRRETGADKVDLLTHSSGGLLALDLLGEHPDWIRRVCVIAIPWRGVSWRGPVLGTAGSQLRAGSSYARSRPDVVAGAPVLSIYSLHDNLVHPASTSQVPGPHVTLLEVENLGHLSVLFDREVGDAVCEFLLSAKDDENGRHGDTPE